MPDDTALQTLSDEFAKGVAQRIALEERVQELLAQNTAYLTEMRAAKRRADFAEQNLSALSKLFGHPYRWCPTHRHSTTGKLYMIQAASHMKEKVGAEWIDSITYRSEEGDVCTTGLDRWHEHFEMLPVIAPVEEVAA